MTETQYDESFIEDAKAFADNNQRLFDEIKKRVNAIIRNPIKGKPKTRMMAGLYGTHVGNNWVILYELFPKRAYTQANIDEIDRLYFHRIIHHDKQESAVSSINPVETVTTFEITLPQDNSGHRTVSMLYNTDEVTVEGVTYGQKISVEGTIEDEDVEIKDVIPATAQMNFTKPDVNDLIEA